MTYGASEKLGRSQRIIQNSCERCIMMLVTETIIAWR